MEMARINEWLKEHEHYINYIMSLCKSSSFNLATSLEQYRLAYMYMLICARLTVLNQMPNYLLKRLLTDIGSYKRSEFYD